MPTPFEYTRDVELAGPAILTWYAVATATGLAGWNMPIAPQPDSPMVTEWVHLERFTMNIPLGADGAFQAFSYVVDPIDEEHTRLRFRYFGEMEWPAEHREMTFAAWDQYLVTLERFLARWPHLLPAYIEAEAPHGSVGVNGWAVLQDRLGYESGISLGDAVTIDRPGARQLEGTVDYLTDRFIGIAGDDFQIRFHGRWSLGLPIAVADHRYSDPENPNIDVEAERLAWIEWLTGL